MTRDPGRPRATPSPREHAPGRAPLRLLTVGDNVVDQYPQRGVMYPGGNTVNVAVHASRLGAHAAYLGVLGSDTAGRAVLTALRDEGVDTSHTRCLDGPNARAVVQVVDGNRVFLDGDAGVSNFRLTGDDLRLAGTYDLVHTGECSFLEDQVAELAAATTRLSFDFSERPWDYVQQYAGLVSIAICSAPNADPSLARRRVEQLRALGADTAVVTLGPGGAVALQEELVHRSAPDGPIVDTLGAGDAFIASFLVDLARGRDLGSALESATAYATANCADFGAFGHAVALAEDTTT